MATHPYVTQPLHRNARSRPDQVALICAERRFTNAELVDRVARSAGALRMRGIAPGEPVALLSGNSDLLIVALFATIWAGGVAAPLNTRWSPVELRRSLEDSGAKLLLVDEGLSGSVPGVPGVEVFDLRALSSEEAVEDTGRSGDDAAFLLYTGGTTGAPKGVLLSHGNLMAATTGMLAAGCGTGTTYLHAPPLFHVAGIQVMLAHLLGGTGPQIVPRAFEPGSLLAAIEEHGVTDVMLVPSMLAMVLAHPDLWKRDTTSLERILYGAAPMAPSLLEAATLAFPGAGFIQGYGMTESALTVMLPATFYSPAGRELGKTASIGRPLPLADVAIRNPLGAEVPRGQVGELTVKSPSVMLRYHGRPEETAAATRDGWLWTGDGAYVDDDGFIYLVDRIKDIIITGGENVFSRGGERSDVASGRGNGRGHRGSRRTLG